MNDPLYVPLQDGSEFPRLVFLNGWDEGEEIYWGNKGNYSGCCLELESGECFRLSFFELQILPQDLESLVSCGHAAIIEAGLIIVREIDFENIRRAAALASKEHYPSSSGPTTVKALRTEIEENERRWAVAPPTREGVGAEETFVSKLPDIRYVPLQEDAPYPRLVFLYGWDEDADLEHGMRGYYSGSCLELETGECFPLNIFTPLRLTQELENSGDPAAFEPGLIFVQDISLEIMRHAAAQAVMEKYPTLCRPTTVKALRREIEEFNERMASYGTLFKEESSSEGQPPS